MLLHTNARKGAGIVRCQPYRWAAFSGLNRPAGAPRDLPELSGHVVLAASQVLRIATRAPRALLSLPSLHVAWLTKALICCLLSCWCLLPAEVLRWDAAALPAAEVINVARIAIQPRCL